MSSSLVYFSSFFSFLFFFNATATTEIYTLSLHDALPIFDGGRSEWLEGERIDTPHTHGTGCVLSAAIALDRKSTRLNSSHTVISYAVFCLKKKKKTKKTSKK